MLAVASNLNYISNNEVIIDSEFRPERFKFEIIKQHNEDADKSHYPCDQNPIAILIENGTQKLKLSLSTHEANEMIRLLTTVM